MDGRIDAGEDGIVAGQEAGGDGMRCPSCGFENLIGADICDNCGADIFGHDTPGQAPAFKGELMGEHNGDPLELQGRVANQTTLESDMADTVASRITKSRSYAGSADTSMVAGSLTARSSITIALL